jgi:hypothetical protein
VAQKLEVEATPIAPLSVRVVNGNILSCNYEVKDFSCWIQGHTLQMDVKIIDMGAYDLVLGMDWLKKFRPMVCDWLEKWIEFLVNGSMFRLHSILQKQPCELQEISIEQVLKWEKGNELWAAVLLGPADKSSSLVERYL